MDISLLLEGFNRPDALAEAAKLKEAVKAQKKALKAHLKQQTGESNQAYQNAMHTASHHHRILSGMLYDDIYRAVLAD